MKARALAYLLIVLLLSGILYAVTRPNQIQVGTASTETGILNMVYSRPNTALRTYMVGLSGSYIGQVGSNVITSSASFYRPADSTAYAANDVVNNSITSPMLMTFTNASRIAGGSGDIVKALLYTTGTTLTARMRLWLYPYVPNAMNDNAQFNLSLTAPDWRVGYIDFPALSIDGTASQVGKALVTAGYVPTTTLPLAYVCIDGSTALYGMLETLDAFTPVTSTQFLLLLTMKAN
jgi:hypothetical protein